jgi:predicted nucleic acid-binding protein
MQFPEKVLIDTGFIIALFNERDEHHDQAIFIAEQIDSSYWYTTVFVLQETFQLLAKRTNRSKALDCFEIIQDSLILPSLPINWPLQILEILKKYSDADIDLADASLVVLVNHLNMPHIVSVDKRDFSLLKWNSGRSYFENLFYL